MLIMNRPGHRGRIREVVRVIVDFICKISAGRVYAANGHGHVLPGPECDRLVVIGSHYRPVARYVYDIKSVHYRIRKIINAIHTHPEKAEGRGRIDKGFPKEKDLETIIYGHAIILQITFRSPVRVIEI